MGGRRPARQVMGTLVVVAAMAVGCGSDGDGAAPATTTVPPDKVAPRWERLAGFAGTGDQVTDRFEVAGEAIQWRVTLACDDGRVRVGLDGEASALAELTGCPGNTFGFSIRTGPATLDVDATGTWEVLVDQQLDTPVAEPALAGMTEANRVATGDFYGIDQKGTGTVTLYRLAGEGGGQGALRFDPFLVTRNSDLFVWVSEAAAPRTSEEALHRQHVQIGRLTATSGAQNYVLPDTVDVDRVRSVVVWCEPVQTAYAAAALS
ncbi:MAG TPA: DM13 domain-containing protein [Acidimicrobiales bacterium]